ncbi:hypothetical protein FGG08_006743 [Glutinoglossum americanum]|uniref:Heterokaryon incompatibility domain-containing protein n=1 Tax=Glutinoglossum americanum TaxID=1670608 RepID=A0A9P8I0P0_9PEZI|nr:hypothetical protein FGG08_006743 [Glutinoglossum americanum]
MVSQECQGGGTYGGQKEPPYGILTYTWGRWEISQGPAIDIKGTTWKIPAVQESHFTVEAFRRVIERVGEDVEYVWIDIACIDQEDDVVKMDEVGKQVGIFRGAHRVYVWLNRLAPSELQRCLDDVFQHGPELHYEKSGPGVLQCLQTLVGAFEILFSDPWFSSLWTLQESILRRDAMILSREASPVLLGFRDGNAFLASLISACQNIYKDCARVRTKYSSFFHDPSIKETADKLYSMIEQVGFQFLYCSNPNMQYGAARFRKTSREEDRIYGIMQIYGLDIGSSSSPDHKPVLEQLEDKFGKALISRSPILSQMFTHVQTPPHGKSWRITQHSRVPEELEVYYPPAAFSASTSESHPSPEIPHCQITTHPISGQIRVSGKSWPFANLLKYWHLRWDPYLDTPQKIMLDDSSHTLGRLPPRLSQFNLPPDNRQFELGKSLVALLGEANLIWFLLGETLVRTREYGPVYANWFLGLVLLRRPEEGWWERVGVCSWNAGEDFSLAEQPELPCPQWELFEGQLG